MSCPTKEQIDERKEIIQRLMNEMPREGSWRSMVEIAASFVCTMMVNMFNEQNFPDKQRLFLSKIECISAISQTMAKTAIDIDIENDINPVEMMAELDAENQQRWRPH